MTLSPISTKITTIGTKPSDITNSADSYHSPKARTKNRLESLWLYVTLKFCVTSNMCEDFTFQSVRSYPRGTLIRRSREDPKYKLLP